MKSIILTSLAFGLLASLANANSLELNFNGDRINDLSKYSETSDAKLFKRDQMIAWNKPVAIFMNMPDIDETIKTKQIIRTMRPIKIGDRTIQCRATGPVSDDDMARPAHEQTNEERMMQFYKVQVLRVESVKRTAISFSMMDNDEPSSKRLICSFVTTKNGQPVSINMETPITVEEVKEYITQNNRVQLREQYQTVEEIRKIREAYKKQQLEDKMAQEKLDEVPATELEKLLGRINRPKNQHSAVVHSLFEDNLRTQIVEAYRFPKHLSEIEPEEKTEQVKAKASTPAKTAEKSGAQAEGVGF